jgi:molybdate transport system ATP-binding protein
MLHIQLRKQRGDFTLDVDFVAPIPGVTALFGRSGCGKSTLISLIAGLLSPDAGRVQIGDDTLLDTSRGLDVDTRHRRVGVVFQDARLFPHLSVLGNLQYGEARFARQRGADRFRRCDVTAGWVASPRRRMSFPVEKQRVAGARCFAQPRLLLLDEPLRRWTRRDARNCCRTSEIARRVRNSIVYVSHQFDECCASRRA